VREGLAAVRYNLQSLFRFGGRDGRATFWPYAGSVFGLAVLVLMAAMARVASRMMQFAQDHPDRARVETGGGGYSVAIEGKPPELAGAFGDMMVIVNLLFAACIVLLAAAVARRLHDTGRSGAWGLMPVPFIVFSGVMMGRLFGQDDIPIGAFLAVFVSNLLYLASLAVLVTLLAKQGQAGPNLYGPGPA
jgi:uncharacterized membrane protein YhaH (DUF805 family)